ncbi:extracellular solute-binding protein [Paenibacillus sediminis]|uniref:Multiple sugar transport system substrate-binding protein n=1 Tax=Paenibacillus sediminis TaxID=664909 RepID=A0ABS4H3R8_9BACL|nr:extracellular solute-binding protein [Paenibacillus sediminis]MBP1937174.1 multiple sugar transport system substrate-binding protein [Paenibacillus sediminis]
MKKSWLVLMLALILVIITACGNSGSSKGNSEGEKGSDAKQDTVVVWTYPVHGKYEDDLKQLLADFKQKHPNINVETEVLSWAEGPEKFTLALNAGNPPDLYFHSVDGSYVDTGLVLPLDKYLTPEIKDDYLPGTLELGQIKGTQYGLPLYQFQWAWGGNKRILEEAGIDWQKIQKEGWTWSEFEAAASKLMKKLPDGSTQYPLVTDGTSLDFIEMLTRNNNMPDVLNEAGEFQWNDGRILDTLTFIQDLLKKGYMPAETAALAPAKRTEMFYAGQAAIISKAIPYYDVMIQNRNKDIDSGTVQGEKIDFVLLPVPHNDNAPAQTTMGGEGYVAFKQKKDKGEEHAKNTFLVMEALSGAQAGNSANELVLPFVRKSQADLFAGKGLGNKVNIEAAETMAKNISKPVVLNLDINDAAKMKQFKEQVVKPNMQALYSGEKTPQEIADDFIQKGKQILGK